MKFDQLGLAEPILRAVTAEGYTVPTPIQSQAIPHVLRARDLLGCAQTGTGKTAAFALPILHRLSENTTKRDPNARGPKPTRALILAPTRELASQIADSFATYGKNLRLHHAVIFGGVSQFHQVKALKRGVDIIIATPGRLLDLMNQGHVDLRALEILVLDEADRMLDMGFIHDIRKIIKSIPAHRQTLLFSATMPSEIRSLAATVLRDPVSVQVNPPASTVQAIDQSVYFVSMKQKAALLTHLHKNDTVGFMSRTLVFTRTKHGADKVVKHLNKAGIAAEALHSNKSQNARMRTLKSFKTQNPPVLVATDIASRGIDVDGISHVINFDVPHEPESYVHRIGRTARAGASGIAIAFCDPSERNNLRQIERVIRATIAIRPPVANFVATTDHDSQSHDHDALSHDHDERAPRPHQRRSHHASSKPAAGTWRKKKRTHVSSSADKPARVHHAAASHSHANRGERNHAAGANPRPTKQQFAQRGRSSKKSRKF